MRQQKEKEKIHKAKRLEGVDSRLVYIAKTVSNAVPLTIIDGLRSIERQKEYLEKKGKPKVTKTLNSKHIEGKALDMMPQSFEGWGDIPDKPYLEPDEVKRIAKERAKFYFFAAVVLTVAHMKGIKLRWGGDWDGDGFFKDQEFDDLVHFELID